MFLTLWRRDDIHTLSHRDVWHVMIISLLHDSKLMFYFSSGSCALLLIVTVLNQLFAL